MTVKRAKTKKKSDCRTKILESALEEVQKAIIPDFVLLILLAMIDELKYGDLNTVTSCGYNAENYQTLIAGISARFDRYCGYISDNAVSRAEAKRIFQDMTDTRFEDAYFGW